MFHFSVSKPSRVLYGIVIIFLILFLVGLVSRLYFKNRNDTNTGSGDNDVEIVLQDGIKSIFSEAEIAKMFSDFKPQIEADTVSINAISTNTLNMEGVTELTTNKRVVVYHTHDTEAYKKTSAYKYKESAEARTENQNYSVVKVGQELVKQMYLQCGIRAIHDTSTHEQPKLSTAYSRSLKTAEEYSENAPDDVILIDVHRDAFSSRSWNPSYVVIEGKRVARIMVVIGKGKGFKDSPDWEKNLKYAQELTDALNKIHPDLARQVKIKDGRYNQHLSESAILIEVGHHHNTLDEAINVTPYLAKALGEVFFSLP